MTQSIERKGRYQPEPNEHMQGQRMKNKLLPEKNRDYLSWWRGLEEVGPHKPKGNMERNIYQGSAAGVSGSASLVGSLQMRNASKAAGNWKADQEHGGSGQKKRKTQEGIP